MRDTGDEPLSELVSRVVDDGKAFARAEVDLAKARVVGAIAGYRNAAILFAVAAVLALAALPALLVGLILTLAQYLGAGIATAIVIGTTLILAGLLGWLGMRRVRQR